MRNMKKVLLSILLLPLLIGCGQNNVSPTNPDEGGGQGGGEEETSATIDFTVTHESVDNIPSAGDNTNTKFLSILNKYYFTSKKSEISSFSGEYININSGFDVTKTRYYPQMMMLGSRKKAVDFTFNFVNTIRSVTFVCEPYCKYSNYGSAYNVDYSTYLTVNGEQKDLGIHSQSDVNEIQNLKYTVNSNQIRLQAPNTNTGEGDTKANRIIVYQMILEF